MEITLSPKTVFQLHLQLFGLSHCFVHILDSSTDTVTCTLCQPGWVDAVLDTGTDSCKPLKDAAT